MTSKGLKGACEAAVEDFDLKNLEGGLEILAEDNAVEAGLLGCMIGSKSLSRDEVFFDLKNFLGRAPPPVASLAEITGAERIEVKEAEPHFPTIPADFEADTPGKINFTGFLTLK